MEIIAVGSSNPVKVQAAEQVAIEYFGSLAKVVSYSVSSNVSHMPMSTEETRLGAKNQAKAAFNLAKSEFKDRKILGVGAEGGITKIEGKWYMNGTTFATDGVTEAFGGESLVLLPKLIVDKINGGLVELGHVIDDITGEKNTKHKGGAIAILTNQKVQRVDLFKLSLFEAFSPWVHPY
jgi:inosine/xanthosine triphosphatase